MKKAKLIVISGPSGVGKGTIIKNLLKSEKHKLAISMTTRPIREGEKHGVHYYFVTKNEFIENIKNNNFIEYAEVYKGIYYGTLKSEVERTLKNNINVILEIDIEGALNIKKIYKDAILIFIEPPSIEELEKRLRERKTEQEDKIIERINKAHYELKMKDKYDYIVINDNVEKATKEIENIIENETKEKVKWLWS